MPVLVAQCTSHYGEGERLQMVASNDGSRADVERVNQQLEERHYEFRSNCHDGEG